MAKRKGPVKGKRPVLKKTNHRSKLEDRIASQLENAGITYQYETLKVPYVVPARNAKYIPDFIVGTMIVEGKGRFRTAADRQKLILVKEQNPHLDIRIVFQRASNPIYKGSKTTYAKWAEDHGFLWADGGVIPEEWINDLKEAEDSHES